MNFLHSRYILAVFMVILLNTVHAQVYNIKDYGAVSDGKTNNTAAIQKAINACFSNGGGRVYIPAGIFVTGTVNLKSNINLYLENGAVLSASTNLKDYQTYTVPEYGVNHYGILYTADAENVSVTGQGTIDGNNKLFYDFNHAKTMDANSTKLTRQKDNFRRVTSGIGDGPVVPLDRPRQMVIFARCKNVQMRDISLLNSFFWTLHFVDCDMVNVNGIRLWSGILVPNADGIDVNSCSNVVIANCDIRTGDDAIAITGFDHHFEMGGFSGLRHASDNIIVSNCNLQSASSGIRIGFLDQNTVRNIQVSHVNITNSTRGIGIFLRDEGSLENISFSDMNIETHLRTGDWWGNGEPIHISAVRGKENVKLGIIKNVSFNNITCKGENGMIIYGSDESVIQDVRFNNVSFELMNSKLNDIAGGNIDLRGALYEKDQLFASDIPGLLAHYVNGLTFSSFKLKWDDTINQPYFTNGIEVNNFKGLQINGFSGGAAPANKNASRIFLSKGDGVVLDNKEGLKTEGVSDIKLK
ncbi:glycoside hydrolase family 28 protein [Mucilaginibacter flavus]|uniref:glycoside hydrolase family 28 protein n=1 Tax=Mucilaginibacter flavus TaxID=931504 RepID=UPI0025B322B2|nr:glycosyl hydrolase family 28 protein [Mucilaginibacter flavus]MDN3579984.1 glycosyl hydrolase family 28 protein [Mucilaginibacter flavus]